MAEGDLDKADALLCNAPVHAIDPGELLYLRGVIANRRRDPTRAVRLLTSALASGPQSSPAWLALGHARVQLGRLAAAAEAYESAIACEPDAADAYFNLGVVRRRLEDLPRAARAFHAAWLRDPLMSNAAKACVGTLGMWVRSAPAETPGPSMPLEPDARTISVITCSIDDAKGLGVSDLYARLLAGLQHEIIVLRDASSLAEAYNRGLDAAKGDVVVLSHDDIEILAPDFAARLLRHLRTYDVVGVIGATRMTGPLPIWAGHPHLRGWITHHAPGSAEWHVDVLDPRPVAGDVKVLDGVLLAGRREVFASVRFDPGTFDGFHCYDIDWSCRAAEAGFRVAAAGDLLVVHASRGRYDNNWQRYAERFCAKHRTGHGEPAPPPFYEIAFDSAAHVRSFYARLSELAATSAE